MRFLVGALTACLLGLSGCSDTPPRSPSPNLSPSNLVPPAGALVTGYADCLKAQALVVDKVVGVWIVVRDNAPDAVAGAQKACADERRALMDSLGKDHRVADGPGARFLQHMRWCMYYYAKVSLPDDDVVFDSTANAKGAQQFDQCIELARNYDPKSPWPSAGPLATSAQPSAGG